MELPSQFRSPFNGDFPTNQITMLRFLMDQEHLQISTITDQPVISATVQYPLASETIDAGQGRYYGLAFFYYCLQKYGTDEEKVSGLFTITFPMIVEAVLYYGAKLWSDDSKPHPSIMPFRIAAQDVKSITVQLKYEPNH